MKSVCEQHDSPIFTLVANTWIDDETKKVTFELCRFCYEEQKITCPGCKGEVPIMNLEDETYLDVDASHQEIKCRCGEVLVESNIPQ